jgi:hypothetical protein
MKPDYYGKDDAGVNFKVRIFPSESPRRELLVVIS